MPTFARPRTPLLIAGILLLLSTLAITGAAVTLGPRLEVGILVSEGKPRAVAECMVQLRQSWGQCEVGMFTGTYLAQWDSTPELRAVRDAVADLRRRGGEWSFAHHRRGLPWSVCATLPGAEAACSVNVQSALSLALGEPAPGAPPVYALSPASRRRCTAHAAAAVRQAMDGDAPPREAARTRSRLARQARACGAAVR